MCGSLYFFSILRFCVTLLWRECQHDGSAVGTVWEQIQQNRVLPYLIWGINIFTSSNHLDSRPSFTSVRVYNVIPVFLLRAIRWDTTRMHVLHTSHQLWTGTFSCPFLMLVSKVCLTSRMHRWIEVQACMDTKGGWWASGVEWRACASWLRKGTRQSSWPKELDFKYPGSSWAVWFWAYRKVFLLVLSYKETNWVRTEVWLCKWTKSNPIMWLVVTCSVKSMRTGQAELPVFSHVSWIIAGTFNTKWWILFFFFLHFCCIFKPVEDFSIHSSLWHGELAYLGFQGGGSPFFSSCLLWDLLHYATVPALENSKEDCFAFSWWFRTSWTVIL